MQDDPSTEAPAHAEAVKKARKPRAPRKRKAKETATESPLPGETAPAIETSAAALPATPAPVIEEERAAIQAEPSGPDLQGAKPRKSGRRAWEINLRGDHETWERVSTPDNRIVFRFRDEPTGPQHELIHRCGFRYDEERKEASRPDDPTGRTYADKLSWYLKDLQRGQEAGRAAG